MSLEQTGTPGTSDSVVFRACGSAYALVAGGWLVLFLGSLYLASHRSPFFWQPCTVTGSVLIFLLIWLRSFEITIADGVLFYRSLLGGNRSLKLKELEKAEIKIDTADKVGPVYKLILWPFPTSDSERIVINMKVFSKGDLNHIFDVLGPKLRTQRKFSVLRSE